MTIKDAIWHLRRPLVVSTAAAVLIGLGTLVGLALPQYSISQKGREFRRNQHQVRRDIANRQRRCRPVASLLRRFPQILIRLRRPAAR